MGYALAAHEYADAVHTYIAFETDSYPCSESVVYQEGDIPRRECLRGERFAAWAAVNTVGIAAQHAAYVADGGAPVARTAVDSATQFNESFYNMEDSNPLAYGWELSAKAIAAIEAHARAAAWYADAAAGEYTAEGQESLAESYTLFAEWYGVVADLAASDDWGLRY